jgi:hypothetical protein
MFIEEEREDRMQIRKLYLQASRLQFSTDTCLGQILHISVLKGRIPIRLTTVLVIESS